MLLLLVWLGIVRGFLPRSLRSVHKNTLKCTEILFNPADDELYNIFWNQINELSTSNTGSGASGDSTNNREPSRLDRFIKINQNRKLVENYVRMSPGVPIEFIFNKKLMFGNFRQSNPKSGSIKVTLASGSHVDIDIGQVISTWDVLADETAPSCAEDWADVAMEALDILGSMSPRKSDLQEFHEILSTQRSANIPVDSLDLGVYIFQERRFKSWVNPYNPAENSGVFALSAAQRYAAALLLYYDDFHFKRKQSTAVRAWEMERKLEKNEIDLERFMEDIDDDDNADDSADSLYVVEGGFKLLDEGVVTFREGDAFVAFYEERKSQLGAPKTAGVAGAAEGSAASPFRAGCVSKQLRAIEMYSMSPANASPPPAVKHLLKRLSFPLTPQGAKQLLMSINHEADNSSTKKAYGNAALTPWTEEVLSAAETLSEEVRAKRKELGEAYLGRAGKKGPSGRMDYRSAAAEYPPICIDNRRASFFDDAFSISPETGELLVHIVDVQEYLRRHPVLQQTAQERLASTFLPTGPVHMIPPLALDGLKLSTQTPNEVITAALSVDAETGTLIGFRIFPSIIGPVFPIDVETADEILQQIKTSEEEGRGTVKRVGFSDSIVSSLAMVSKLVDKMIEKQPWVDESFSSGTGVDFNLNKRTGIYQQVNIKKTSANRMVNAMLTAYSNATVEYCQAKEVSVPIAWENRDKKDTSRISRFGTQPLRNWLAQLQQKQIRGALKLEIPLTTKECALAVSYHNANRKQLSAFERKGREIMSFESLESHCNAMNLSGQSLIVTAEGLGNGGEVRIKEYRVHGVINKTVGKGELLKVVVKRVVPETKSVILESVV